MYRHLCLPLWADRPGAHPGDIIPRSRGSDHVMTDPKKRRFGPDPRITRRRFLQLAGSGLAWLAAG